VSIRIFAVSVHGFAGSEVDIGAFLDNEVDGEILQQLTADDLKEIGVAAIDGGRRDVGPAIPARGGAPPAHRDVRRPGGLFIPSLTRLR
jgi:SAM domain (Sterile alpha motif)